MAPKLPSMSIDASYAQATKTKPNRFNAALIFKEATEGAGAIVYYHNRPNEINIDGPREITIYLEVGPFVCSMSLDGSLDLGAFLTHWFTDYKSDTKYPPGFSSSINGGVNEYHGRKATGCYDTYGELIAYTVQGVQHLRAYLEDRPSLLEALA